MITNLTYFQFSVNFVRKLEYHHHNSVFHRTQNFLKIQNFHLLSNDIDNIYLGHSMQTLSRNCLFERINSPTRRCVVLYFWCWFHHWPFVHCKWALIHDQKFYQKKYFFGIHLKAVHHISFDGTSSKFVSVFCCFVVSCWIILHFCDIFKYIFIVNGIFSSFSAYFLLLCTRLCFHALMFFVFVLFFPCCIVCCLRFVVCACWIHTYNV